ncbi:MAG: S8 family serine peptidase [Bernardetiaceae bacterium]|nr:S8 family serine peptidase [Bernardetiaceae bacterium]
MIRTLFLSLFLGATFLSLQAQDNRYWVFLEGKDSEGYDYHAHLSAAAIQKRQLQSIPLWQYSDIPVKADYVKAIAATGAKVHVLSKWFNAVSVTASDAQKNAIEQLDFVSSTRSIDTRYQIMSTQIPTEEDINYGPAMKQMEVEVLRSEGLNGEGIIIGIIDAGFHGATDSKYLKHVFQEERILGMRDIVEPEKTQHFDKGGSDHGKTVLEMVTGYDEKSYIQGAATHAKFYLARSEDAAKEYRKEEDYWISAIEWMDSLGVRLINTSLGYSSSFTDPEENYKTEEMDGKTALITRGAQTAVEEKGLLLVVSAGNEGSDKNWRIVSAPADAQGVLSIGATNTSGLKMGYSSIGPAHLPYLKPNVSCFSLFGTSFSAPNVTGFAACLMQRKPEATGKEIFEVIEKSASFYPLGNNYIGYGIPSATRALALLEGKDVKNKVEHIKVSGSTYDFKYKTADENDYVLVFHKSDERNVVSQEYLKESKKNKYEFKKAKGAKFSTVKTGDTLIEIEWVE